MYIGDGPRWNSKCDQESRRKKIDVEHSISEKTNKLYDFKFLINMQCRITFVWLFNVMIVGHSHNQTIVSKLMVRLILFYFILISLRLSGHGVYGVYPFWWSRQRRCKCMWMKKIFVEGEHTHKKGWSCIWGRNCRYIKLSKSLSFDEKTNVKYYISEMIHKLNII